MLEFCLVTFDLNEIRVASALFPINCYADNPTVAAVDLADGRTTFLVRSREIRSAVGDEVPFYLEVLGDTCREMVEDARRIVEEVPGNTLVKIPACPEGYKAIAVLKAEGIRTSCTAIYTFNQAMLAALAGAEYVAVYVSRLDRNGSNGIECVRRIKEAFLAHDIRCNVSAASIKSAGEVERAIEAGADNIALNLELLEQMAVHPMTAETLETFKTDWESLFGVGVRIANMVA